MYLSRRKRKILKRKALSAAAAAALLVLSVFSVIGIAQSGDAESAVQSDTVPAPHTEQSASLKVVSVPSTEIFVKVYDGQGIVQTALEDYVYHVLAAEMPASYDAEALKAQAVAIRTYTAESMRSFGGSGCSMHEEADICIESAHCQSYASDDRLKNKWGDQYRSYAAKLRQAVRDTTGQVARYDGALILALFHANAGGQTENVEEVFARTLPYLRSVAGYDISADEQYRASIQVTARQLAQRINEVYSQAKVDAQKLANQLKILERTGSGRVKRMQVGEIELTGVQMRRLLKLNSANFDLAFSDESVVFTTYGRGHGVGMSQEGANEMAKSGYDYLQILMHYYSGVTIDTLRS